MSRAPWGHVSTYCARCGKVGPRCWSTAGKIHAYCRTDDEKRAERADQRAARSRATKAGK